VGSSRICGNSEDSSHSGDDIGIANGSIMNTVRLRSVTANKLISVKTLGIGNLELLGYGLGSH
jgi:hypothetical protein